jgi:hypothetical protein
LFNLQSEAMTPRFEKQAFVTFAAAFATLVGQHLDADANPSRDSFRPHDASLAVNLGQLQPWLLGGANIEGDFRLGHLVVGYSHGWSLDLEGSTIKGDMQRQQVTLHIPYTTGVGIGYSQYLAPANSYVDLRFEAKLHRFEAAYDSADGRQRTQIADYSTVTLGAGAYWTWMPFVHGNTILHGLNISTSLRYWPKIASTLEGNAVTYRNATTGQDEIHKTAEIGIANTPVIVNLSLGYVFQ